MGRFVVLGFVGENCYGFGEFCGFAEFFFIDLGFVSIVAV